MAAREYVGAGGMRVLLDEPLDPMMAAQVHRGELRLAEDGDPLLDPDQKVQPQVIQHGADAPAATRVGKNVHGAAEKPEPGDHTGAWATYAVRLGLLATKASTMSHQQLLEWVEAVEETDTGVVGDAGEGVRGPEHASVDGRPSEVRGDVHPKPEPQKSDAPAEEGDGESSADLPKKPAANAKVDTWRGYAVALGMDPDEAKDATKQECQDYAQVVEDARDPEGQE
ncbi:hypothetical protein GTY83_07005 [Streptomyces sp. SID4928]|uniref:hypothetical protein n=1 Tax=Streptomyces TaxID=1883 RepID=UPI0001C1CEFB|nr:hypothetical protein [Streptomyces sp. ACT-1]EGE40779.1 hypothetical protein SACT1_1414 [Streptomyces sp. ACT-1]MYR48853.1 hypothetical protein [Streptomyces sp. SID4928]